MLNPNWEKCSHLERVEPVVVDLQMVEVAILDEELQPVDRLLVPRPAHGEQCGQHNSQQQRLPGLVPPEPGQPVHPGLELRGLQHGAGRRQHGRARQPVPVQRLNTTLCDFVLTYSELFTSPSPRSARRAALSGWSPNIGSPSSGTRW